MKTTSHEHTWNPDTAIHTEYGEVIQCERCGFWHIYPYLAPPDLSDFYTETYSDDLKKRNLQDKLDTITQLRFRKTERAPSESPSLLDIGCGHGDFLALAKAQNWLIQGVEPSKRISKEVSETGIPVMQGMYPDLDLTALGCYDVVNLSFVLEHVAEPIAFLETLITHQLKDDGMLVIEVPNDFNPFQQAATHSLAIPQWWVKLPDHQNYFDHNTLAQLLHRLGLDVLYQTTGFPIDIFLLFGDDYISHPELGKSCHKKRVHFEECLDKYGFREMRQSLYQRFAELGLGREVICFAQKKKSSM